MAAATTVADIMERDAPSIALEASVEEVIAQFKELDVPALPVVNDGGRCVGVITEKDLVIADEDGDLHIPHYIELFGGLVFFPPELRAFERRLRKAAAAQARDLMTEPAIVVEPSTTLHEAAHRRARALAAAGRRARALRRARHAGRRPGGAERHGGGVGAWRCARWPV
jgi:CBS domain-containing protein